MLVGGLLGALGGELYPIEVYSGSTEITFLFYVKTGFQSDNTALDYRAGPSPCPYMWKGFYRTLFVLLLRCI